MYSTMCLMKTRVGKIALSTRDEQGKKIEEEATVPMPLGMYPDLCVEMLSRLKVQSRVKRKPFLGAGQQAIEIEDWTKLIYAKSVLEGLE